jgi:hypothetical protein
LEEAEMLRCQCEEYSSELEEMKAELASYQQIVEADAKKTAIERKTSLSEEMGKPTFMSIVKKANPEKSFSRADSTKSMKEAAATDAELRKLKAELVKAKADLEANAEKLATVVSELAATTAKLSKVIKNRNASIEERDEARALLDTANANVDRLEQAAKTAAADGAATHSHDDAVSAQLAEMQQQLLAAQYERDAAQAEGAAAIARADKAAESLERYKMEAEAIEENDLSKAAPPPPPALPPPDDGLVDEAELTAAKELATAAEAARAAAEAALATALAANTQRADADALIAEAEARAKAAEDALLADRAETATTLRDAVRAAASSAAAAELAAAAERAAGVHEREHEHDQDAALSAAKAERDAALEQLKAATAGRDAAVEQLNALTASKAGTGSPVRSASSRRRSTSTSSLAGSDAERADAVERKLEMKMAELAKMKAQLKAEKSSSRKSMRELTKEHQKAMADRIAAEKARADALVDSTRGALAQSQTMNTMLTQATTMLSSGKDTELTQDVLAAQMRTRQALLGPTGPRSADDGSSGRAPSTVSGAQELTARELFEKRTGTAASPVENPHPWWLEKKASGGSGPVRRPRAPPQQRGPDADVDSGTAEEDNDANIVPAKAPHTGRRTWNEDMQVFQDRSTPISTPAASVADYDGSQSPARVMLEGPTRSGQGDDRRFTVASSNAGKRSISDYDFIDDGAPRITRLGGGPPSPERAATKGATAPTQQDVLHYASQDGKSDEQDSKSGYSTQDQDARSDHSESQDEKVFNNAAMHGAPTPRFSKHAAGLVVNLPGLGVNAESKSHAEALNGPPGGQQTHL